MPDPRREDPRAVGRDRDGVLEVRRTASRPSVEIVQPSSASHTSGPPAVIIGSIAIVIPSESRGPRPGSPKFGMCGSSW